MRRFPILALVLVCVVALLVPAAYAEGGQSVTVSRKTEFAETSGASRNVKAECTLGTRLPGFIRDFAKAVDIDVVLADEVDDNTAGRVLHLEVTNVVGAGGGAWSGAKSVTARGKLTENGEVIGNFVSSRYSGGGAFGGYKGTCSILGRCIKAMGKDISRWLAHPSMDARLGDA